MRPRLKLIYDAAGGTLLFDIWIDGEWHGSRRTYDYCVRYLNHVLRKDLTNGDSSRTIDSART